MPYFGSDVPLPNTKRLSGPLTDNLCDKCAADDLDTDEFNNDAVILMRMVIKMIMKIVKMSRKGLEIDHDNDEKMSVMIMRTPK
ncbi:hypothetical protein PoB_006075600 [Plakobranchus ocellatus]|uniref:Uncharacterized protein n=1 Tax=Plakobranchus ocellatus TaxID=259542 RepID=A0AAV4CQX1_9GAST|nr:hypothetical protein PoB_006075600 [Plakobranchus ocellatus]